MAVRFTSTWFDVDGEEFKISIFDDAYTDGSVEQTLRGATPGFELSYESEADQPYQGIIASTLTVHLVNEGGAFDTWLQGIPSITGENDVTIVLFRKTPQGFQKEWAGVIMVDQITLEDAPSPSLVKLVANDGTAALKNVYPDLTTLTNTAVKDWLIDLLTDTKSAVHWETGSAFLRAWTDFKPQNWGTLGSSGLNVLDVASFPGVFDPTTINVVDGTPKSHTAWTMLQSLCMVFNARLCLSGGEWHFWPVNQHIMHAEGTDYTYLHVLYSKAGTIFSQSQSVRGEFKTRTTPQLGPVTTASRYVQLSGGSISHTIPLKTFKRARPYRGQQWLNNSIRTGSLSAINTYDNGLGLADFSDPRSFFEGARFSVEGNIQVSRAASSEGLSGTSNFTGLRMKFNFDVGDYRYNPGGNTWDTDQSTDRYLNVMSYIGQINLGIDGSFGFNLVLPPLPADSETMDVVMDADFYGTTTGSDLNAIFTEQTPPTSLGCAITTTLINDANEDLLIFQGESGLDNSEDFDQGNLILGTVNQSGTNEGEITAVTSYQGVNNVNWDMGTWVSTQSTSGEHLNRLCVREAIALLQKGLPKREGQIKIADGMRIPSPLMTIKDEAGSKHFMVTSCHYSAHTRIASITRLELPTSGITTSGIVDNGSEGKRGPSTASSAGAAGATSDNGSGGGSQGSGPGASILSKPTTQLNRLGEFIKVADDGIIGLTPKTGETIITADDVSETSTKKLLTSAERTKLAAVPEIYVLAAHSGRASMYYANRYYFGSSSYGWDTDTSFTSSQTSVTSINDQYAHAGVILPTTCSSIKLFTTIRNDSSATDVDVYLFAGSRPDGSSASITLTQLGTAKATCSQNRDLHFNADVTASGLNLAEGTLIFFMLRRKGTTGTQYINYTYTIQVKP